MAFAVVSSASLKNQNTGFKVVEHKAHRHAMERLEPDLAATIFHGIQRNPLQRTTTVKPVMFPKSPTMRGKRSSSHEAAAKAINDFTSIDRVVFLGNDDPLHEEYDSLSADFDLDAKPIHIDHVDKPDDEVSFSVTSPVILDELEEIGETSILPSGVTRKVIDEEPTVVTGSASEASEATTVATLVEGSGTEETTTDETATEAVANTSETVLSTSDDSSTTDTPTTTTSPVSKITLINEVVATAVEATSTPWPEVVVIQESIDAKPAESEPKTAKPIGVTVPSFDLSEDDETESETEKPEAAIPPRAQPVVRQEVQPSSDHIVQPQLTPNRRILDSSVVKRRNIISNDPPPSAFQKFFRRRELLRAQQANEFRFRSVAARRVKRAAEYEDYDTVSIATTKAEQKATTPASGEWNTDATRPTFAPKLVPKGTEATTTPVPTTTEAPKTEEAEKTETSDRPLTAAQKLARLEASAPQRRGLITGKTGRNDGQIRPQTVGNGRIQIKYIDSERPVVPDRSFIRILPNLVPKKPAQPLRDTPNAEKPIIEKNPVRVNPTKAPRPIVSPTPAPQRTVFQQVPVQRFQQPQPQLVFPQGPNYPPVQIWQQPQFRNPQFVQRPFPPVSIDTHRQEVSILPVPTPRPTTRRPVVRSKVVHSGDVVKEVGPRVQQQELNIVRIYQHFGTTKQAFVRPATTPAPTTTEKPTTTTTQRPKWVGVTFTTHPTPTAPFDEDLVSTPAPKAASHVRTHEFDLYDEVNAETTTTTTTTTPTSTTTTPTSTTTTQAPTTTTEESIAVPQSAEKFVHVHEKPDAFPDPDPSPFDYITDEEAASEKVAKKAKQQPKLVKFADSEDVKAFPARDFTGDAPSAHPDLRGFGDKVITSVGLS
uniref:DUF4758 domain-containing protein n=1 Tax=Panagrellus redivivus TaxID=6233 RepID=A0A7E4UTI8_PANRE